METTDSGDDEDYKAAQAERRPFFRTPLFRTSEPSSPKTPRDAGASLYEAVFVKENVSIHPTQGSNDQIAGRLRLIKQIPSLFMTWIPYLVSGVSAQDRSLYTIRAVAVTEIRSIRRHCPALGHHHIIVVLTSGLSYPPLYFHNGGVGEFVSTLRDYAQLVRSTDDPNLFLVTEAEDPLQQSLARLTEVSGVSGRGEDTGAPGSRGRRPVGDAPTVLLQKIGVMSRFARNTTSLLFSPGEDGDRRSPSLPALSGESGWAAGQTTSSPDAREEESGSFEMVDEHPEAHAPALVWARARPPPLTPEEWGGCVDLEGRVVDEAGLRRRVFHSGCDPRVRREVWKVLLDCWPPNLTQPEREDLGERRAEEYHRIKRQWTTISDAQASRFSLFRDRASRVDKDVVRTDRTQPYFEGEDNGGVEVLRSILITYSLYNFDLGYCQGMSDLLAPILVVMGEEVEAFWAFAALMERMAPNFDLDQNGMHSQLMALRKLVQLLDPPLFDYLHSVECLNFFFCFRWVLIHFKREFAYEDVMRLWEVLWSRHLSDHFHLYVCTAILKRHRRKIMDEQMEFDSLLKFTNDLSGRIDLEATLRDAEALCVYAGAAGVACMPQPPTAAEEGCTSPLPH